MNSCGKSFHIVNETVFQFCNIGQHIGVYLLCAIDGFARSTDRAARSRAALRLWPTSNQWITFLLKLKANTLV